MFCLRNLNPAKKFGQIALVALTFLLITTGVAAAETDHQHDAPFISGTVWSDLNQNGIHEPDEPVKANVMVFCEQRDPEGDAIGTAVVFTDENGAFRFSQMEMEAYHIWAAQGQQARTGATIVLDETVHAVSNLEIGLAPQIVLLPVIFR